MGRKGKATKKSGTGEGEGAEEAVTEDDAPAGLAAELAAMLDKLRIEEAMATIDKGLQAAPDSRTLAALRCAAAEIGRHFEADGVRAESGAAETAAGDGQDAAPCGRGLVTTRPFRQGEVIVRERPLLVASRKVVTSGGAEVPEDLDIAAVTEALRALSPAQKTLLAAFQAGMGALPEKLAAFIEREPAMEPLVRFARIMRLNAHEYYPEPGKAALYVLIARANHSCDPACGLGAGAGGELFFYALRDMEAGEYVDYSYLGGHFALHLAATRREQLLRTKLFECRCRRCLVPELPPQPPCGAGGCSGFLQRESGQSGPWRCSACSAEEPEDSQRLGRGARLEPMLAAKVATLEAKWHDPAKDVSKYISDWELLAKSCGQALGERHHTFGRACFFALQALNTGRSLNLGGVDVARHAAGLRQHGLPLARYLRDCCPLGARRASLEPVAAALLLLKGVAQQRGLAAEVVREAGRAELRLPLFEEARNAALFALLDELGPA